VKNAALKTPRNKIRALLLGGGNEDLPEGWGKQEDEVDMQITFTPGLASPVGQHETTIEQYRRQLKGKKKGKKDEARKHRGETGASEIEDEFFGSDDKGNEQKNDRRQKPKGTQQSLSKHTETSAEELALLVAPDDHRGREHFDMRSVLKAEKQSRLRKSKRPKDQYQDSQTDFSIDVNDNRFRVIHEDSNFAIDPTSPQ
jgi:hypothetical protein